MKLKERERDRDSGRERVRIIKVRVFRRNQKIWTLEALKKTTILQVQIFDLRLSRLGNFLTPLLTVVANFLPPLDPLTRVVHAPENITCDNPSDSHAPLAESENKSGSGG